MSANAHAEDWPLPRTMATTPTPRPRFHHRDLPSSPLQQAHDADAMTAQIPLYRSSPYSAADYIMPVEPSSGPHTPQHPLHHTEAPDSPYDSSTTEGDTPKARPATVFTSRPARKPRGHPDLPPPPEDAAAGDTLFSNLRGRIASPTRTSPVSRAAEFSQSPPKSATSPATTPNSSRFSFITSRMAALKALASPVVASPDDELATMDIEAALFPQGAPADGEAFSPAAFKNLQQTATGLLQRYQTAYQGRTAEFKQLHAEKAAVDDEKNEMEMRTQHLKMQLEDMSRKAAETELFMRQLMDELNREKKMRRQAQAINRNGQPAPLDTGVEELSAEYDQQTKTWRRSIEAYKTDHSSDTDNDSVAESSVFSRCRSPAFTPSLSDISPGDLAPHRPVYPDLTPPAHLVRQSNPVGQNALQRLFKNIAGETEVQILQECGKCRGQDASMAWDTANLMKDENRGLKDRVTELESALEGALDIVNGVGL